MERLGETVAILETFDRAFPKGAAAGNRVPDGHLPYLNQ